MSAVVWAVASAPSVLLVAASVWSEVGHCMRASGWFTAERSASSRHYVTGIRQLVRKGMPQAKVVRR